jgi:hypothetical protein
MNNFINFFNNILNDIFILYSSYISHLTNIISIGLILLFNIYSIIHYYYNITHGLDPYVRSEIFYLLIFNFIALITTAVTIYNSNPQIFGNKPTPSPSSTPTPIPTPIK